MSKDNDNNYEDILSQSWDEIPEEKTLPQGSYLLKLRGASFQPPKSEEGNASFLFVYSVKEPMDDVAQDDLEALGADYDFSVNRVFQRIWVEDARDYGRVRDNLAKLGTEVTGGVNIKDSLKAARGGEAIGYLTQRQYTAGDGTTRISNEVQNLAAIEA